VLLLSSEVQNEKTSSQILAAQIVSLKILLMLCQDASHVQQKQPFLTIGLLAHNKLPASVSSATPGICVLDIIMLNRKVCLNDRTDTFLFSSRRDQWIPFVYELGLCHHHAFLVQKRFGSSFGLLFVSGGIAIWSYINLQKNRSAGKKDSNS
jgi:hypothetical protein